MADRKSFLLRMHPRLFDALQRWASDELRSVNGQVEYLLSRSLKEAGRYPKRAGKKPPTSARDRDR